MRIDNALNLGLDKASPAKAAPKKDGDFGNMLMDALKEVQQTQDQSQAAQSAFLAGQPGVEVHDLMIAMEKASTAMQLTLQVRNKMLEAYQEINRMQV
ncbi:MAG: flagellar hook-basal body complex protein FliE [Armatimonadetes bacterium]|nr:flagellar hook-basal body complex protein FliE [Armatimonadota bacterium]